MTQFRKELAAAQQRQIARGFPNFESLLPYMHERQLRELVRQFEDSDGQPAPLTEQSPITSATLRPWIRYQSKKLAVYKRIVATFCCLRDQIVMLLERSDGERRADTKTDKRRIPKKILFRLPKNLDVARLAREINQHHGEERSNTAIALQFTNGDKGRALSLLRQLRRFPHLLNSPES